MYDGMRKHTRMLGFFRRTCILHYLLDPVHWGMMNSRSANESCAMNNGLNDIGVYAYFERKTSPLKSSRPRVKFFPALTGEGETVTFCKVNSVAPSPADIMHGSCIRKRFMQWMPLIRARFEQVACAAAKQQKRTARKNPPQSDQDSLPYLCNSLVFFMWSTWPPLCWLIGNDEA